MKILIINWRDPLSPLEGGAERFSQKYAEFWASTNNQVFWLTNAFENAPQTENLQGVTYIRLSPKLDGSLRTYILAYPVYVLKTIWFAHKFIQKQNIDIVIDEIHGLPFFTPLFSKARNILLVCEVAGPIWDKMFPFPINVIGRWLENSIYHMYKQTEIWAISDNTKQNIQDILPGKKVSVIKLGIDDTKLLLTKITTIKKTSHPSAVFLARLVKMKGIETALHATATLVEDYPDFILYIIGKGESEYTQHLTVLVEQLNITKNVVFLGRLSELEKFSFLKQAHFLFHPSYKEGFGLTVLEAGLVGTPAIVRSGSSLDALINTGSNGYMFTDDSEIAILFKKSYKNEQYKKLSRGAYENAHSHLWPNILKNSDLV